MNLLRELGRVGTAVAALCALLGCSQTSPVRDQIRQYDFRQANREKLREQYAPSPIANVFDMPGWTTDYQGAAAFARVNGRRTVVFVRRDAEAVSEKVVRILNTSSVEQALASSEKVSVDVAANPAVAQSLGVSETPSLVVLDPSGRAVARASGAMTKSQVMAAIQ